MLSKIKNFEFKLSLPFIIKSVAVILFLLICLTAFNHGKAEGFGFDSFVNRDYEYGTTVSERVISGEVDEITVNWQCGDIEIYQVAAVNVKVYESASKEIDSDMFMDITLDSGELIVNWSENGVGASKELGKKLVIELPFGYELDSVTINGGDSNIDVKKLVSDAVTLYTAYGKISFDRVEGDEGFVKASYGGIKGSSSKFESLTLRANEGDLSLKDSDVYTLNLFTASGNTLFDGDFCELTAKSYSGNITAETKYRPHDVNVSSTSGNIVLSLPSNLSAFGEYKTVSGEFVTDYEFKSEEEGIIELNAEEYELNLTTTSGNITLNKGERGRQNSYFSKLLGEDEE